MRKTLAVGLVTCALSCVAAVPDRTSENVAKYKDICRNFVKADFKGVYREPQGVLNYAFIVPGASYGMQLWDWDSWLAGMALNLAVAGGTPEERTELTEHLRGCVLNFLAYAGNGGRVPICLEPTGVPSWAHPQETGITANMHKPCLAQQAECISRSAGDDVAWLRDRFPALQAFVNRYLNHYRHQATGLFFWMDDEAIGVDNDPATFFRPKRSSGSIYLNCLMFRELQAMAYLSDRLGMREIGCYYAREADALLASIRRHCWDPRDGFYYSVDLNLLPRAEIATGLHSGQPRTYDCLIQRLDVWSGFMALWSGVATEDQAREMVERHYRDRRRFNAPAGIRTLSPFEKMYDLRASGNPSPWLGPVWGVSNWMTFRGLVRYGYVADARELAEKTIVVFGKDIEQTGVLHECYLPESGEPIVNPGFQSWNYLVIDMVEWLDAQAGRGQK